MVQPNDIRFNRDRYIQNDAKAKDVSKEFLEQAGFVNIRENIGESKKDFKRIWDIAGDHPELGEWRIEAEIKKDWGTKWFEVPFKWPTMDIPYRKRDKAQEHATHHLVIGGDLNRMFLVSREVVINSPVSEKWCRNRSGMEPFFNVPLQGEGTCFYFKRDGIWKTFEEIKHEYN